MRTLYFVPAAAIALTSLSACKPAAESRSAAPASAQAQPPAAQSVSQAAPVATAGNGFTGAIAETMDSGGYTYARLQAAGKDDVWVAAPQFDAKVGETISVSLDMAMQDFQSKTLNRTFPLLYFVQEVGRNGQAASGGGQTGAPPLMNSHGASAAAATVEKMDPPAGGLSVADVFAKKAALSGKPVTVRGKVVKFNGGIMDRNWLHIQDGSGKADAHDNDLTITTDDTVRVGDVVTMTGIVGTNKDFGAGYAYDVIVEKASLK
jgi:hypothetical protein